MKNWIAKDMESGKAFQISIAGNRAAVESLDEVPESSGERDQVYMSRGLVDLQVNGYDQVDMSDVELSTEKIDHFCRNLARLGVTRFLPTLTTQSHWNIWGRR